MNFPLGVFFTLGGDVMKKGFTFLEFAVLIFFVNILATITIPNFRKPKPDPMSPG
jgi:competence protein ComGC